MEFQKKFKILNCFTGFLVLAGIFSCELSEKEAPSPNVSQEATTESNIPEPAVEEELPLFITYHLDSLERVEEVDSFRNRFSEPEQEFIFALNRVDAGRLNVGDKLVIPDTLTTNFLDYSPFPLNFELLDSVPKVVLISRRIQGFALYENGKLVKWGPVSSGKESTPTPAGLFYGNYKAARKVSTVNDAWILPYYFNFANFEGVGVHQYAMPGYPASHACVRLREEDAIEIYNWADQWKLDDTGQLIRRNGTPFMVFGDYDFDGPLPWWKLTENPNSNFLTAEEMEVLRSYMDKYRNDKRNFDLPAIPVDELAVGTEEVLNSIE